MAKRNCRRTKDEAAIHEKAVKMRKMTDEQLVHYVEDRVEKARSEGFNQGKKVGAEKRHRDFDPAEFIEGIAELPGIGEKSMEKIREYTMEGFYDL